MVLLACVLVQLILSCESGGAETARLLLENGANVYHVDSCGATAAGTLCVHVWLVTNLLFVQV